MNKKTNAEDYFASRQKPTNEPVKEGRRPEKVGAKNLQNFAKETNDRTEGKATKLAARDVYNVSAAIAEENQLLGFHTGPADERRERGERGERGTRGNNRGGRGGRMKVNEDDFPAL